MEGVGIYMNTGVIHVHLRPIVTLTVEGDHYAPEAPDVMDALVRAVEHIKQEPTSINVVTCRVVLKDRRRTQAMHPGPFVDLMLCSRASKTSPYSQETVLLQSESQRLMEEAAILIFLEYLRKTPIAACSIKDHPRSIPTH